MGCRGKYQQDDELFNSEKHMRNMRGTSIKGQIQVLQDWLGLKDENVFINLKSSFLFDFLSEVLTLTKARNLNAKRVISPFKY